MKQIVGIMLVCSSGAVGCLAGGGTVDDRQEAIVTMSDVADLYSESGCADLERSGGSIERVSVEGDPELVAIVADGVVACVCDARTLELAALGQVLEPFSSPGVPTSQTNEEPDPSPVNPAPSSGQEPDPSPVRPAGTGPMPPY